MHIYFELNGNPVHSSSSSEVTSVMVQPGKEGGASKINDDDDDDDDHDDDDMDDDDDDMDDDDDDDMERRISAFLIASRTATPFKTSLASEPREEKSRGGSTAFAAFCSAAA